MALTGIWALKGFYGRASAAEPVSGMREAAGPNKAMDGIGLRVNVTPGNLVVAIWVGQDMLAA